VPRAVTDPDRMRFGVEAEFALVGPDGELRDFATLSYRQASSIVERLGDGDHPDLVRGDLGIKHGRWYVEGDERFDDGGRLLDCVPKGIETRTRPQAGIPATVAALDAQTAALAAAAWHDHLRLASIGWNPHRPGYRPDPPYNRWEREMRRRHAEYLAADVYMLSYGPDVNLSSPDWDDAAAVDVGRMLTAYSPALVPFSFSAPFVRGRPFGGLSYRTYRRTGRRPAVRVFVDPDRVPRRQPSPPLVHPARIPAERGRVEFKAFDAPPEPALYPALLAVVAGVAADRTLPGRLDRPDRAAHRRAALAGFDAPEVAEVAAQVLRTARRGLRGTGWASLLDPLDASLSVHRTPAHAMIEAYDSHGAVRLPLVGSPSQTDRPPAT
jgi:hypothetical protein